MFVLCLFAVCSFQFVLNFQFAPIVVNGTAITAQALI